MRIACCFFTPFFLLALFSCSTRQHNDEMVRKREAHRADSLSMLKRPCSCADSITTEWHGMPLIRFGNTPKGAHLGASENYKRLLTDDELLRQYDTDSSRLSVKAISFSNYDTIPEKFKIFKNVEYVFSGTAEGLDIFPKLKSVHFFLNSVAVDSTDKWLKRIEILTLEKAEIVGLHSFKPMHNLKMIYLGFGGFLPFPTDIESLTCLSQLTLGAYTTREVIDLSLIDLSKLTCLRKAEFHSWRENMVGIPKGLDKLKSVKLDISHPALTAAEKQVIKSMKKGQ